MFTSTGSTGYFYFPVENHNFTRYKGNFKVEVFIMKTKIGFPSSISNFQ